MLGVVQCFAELVYDIALAYRGHVKDFEGDGVRSITELGRPNRLRRSGRSLRERLVGPLRMDTVSGS